MMIEIGYIGICIFLDMVLGVLFPYDFALFQPIFVPCLGFSAVMLVIQQKELLNKLVLAFVAGIVFDFLNADYFMLNSLVFMACAFLIHIWSKHISSSLLEMMILLLSIIFIKEFLIYFYMSASHLVNMSVMTWLIRYLAMTLLGNALPLLLVLWLNDIRQTIQNRREIMRRKGEKLRWEQIR